MLFPYPSKILNPFHSTTCGLTCMTSRYPEHGPFVPSLQCVPRICFEIITSHDYLRGNPSLLFGRPYQVVFPTHGVATHFYGRSCVSRPYGAGDPTHTAITVEGEPWL
jgi:hypothetical protein